MSNQASFNPPVRPRISYIRELESAGMIDNSACPHKTYSVQTRLDMLLEREKRWLYLEHKNRTLVSIPADVAGVYEVSLGLYMCAKLDGEKRPGALSLPLASIDNVDERGKKKPVWDELNLPGKHVIDFGVAHEEHDLTAFVVGPSPTDTKAQGVYIHLMQHSTHKYHPQTFKRILDVQTPDMVHGHIQTNIRISGENLAVLMEYPLQSDPHSNSGLPALRHLLHVWNWKTASSKTPYIVDSPGIVFLRDDLLLQTNTSLNTLDIYYIPPWVEEYNDPHSSRIVRVGRLQFPALQRGYRQILIQVRSDPSFSTSHLNHISPTYPFYNNPDNSVILMNLMIRDRVDNHHSFEIVAHREALLAAAMEAINAFQNNHAGGFTELRVPWDTWGPHSTRWIPVDPPLNRYITVVSGARVVCLKDQEGHIDLEVYDFLKTRYDRLKPQETQRPKPRKSLADLGRSTTSTSGPKVNRNTPLSAGVALVRASSSAAGGSKVNEHEPPHAEVTFVGRNSPTIIPSSEMIFVKDVQSHLPYIRSCRPLPKEPEASARSPVTKWFQTLTSRDRGSKEASWDWKGVMMDQQHIIGLRFPPEGNVFRPSELDVLYFG